MSLLKEIAEKLEDWAKRTEPKLPKHIRQKNMVKDHIGHLNFYGSLLKALGNQPKLMLTWLRSCMPEQFDSIEKDLNDLYDKAKAVDHERSESGGEANIQKCQAQAAAKRLAEKLRLLEDIIESRRDQFENGEKPAEIDPESRKFGFHPKRTCES